MTTATIDTFPCDARASARLRHWAAEQLRDTRVAPVDAARDELVDDVELVVSELVTNSVRAGCRHLGLTLVMWPRRVAVEVYDDAPGLPEAVCSGPLDSSGRGLALVAALASCWGVRSTSPPDEQAADGGAPANDAPVAAFADAPPGDVAPISARVGPSGYAAPSTGLANGRQGKTVWAVLEA